MTRYRSLLRKLERVENELGQGRVHKAQIVVDENSGETVEQIKLAYAKQHNLELEDIDFFVVLLKGCYQVESEEVAINQMDEEEQQ